MIINNEIKLFKDLGGETYDVNSYNSENWSFLIKNKVMGTEANVERERDAIPGTIF